MNKDEKRKIALEGTSIVAASQKIVDGLERSCGKILVVVFFLLFC